MKHRRSAPKVGKDIRIKEEQAGIGAQPGQGEIPQEPQANDQQMGNEEEDGLEGVPMPVSDVRSKPMPREVYIGIPDRPKKGKRRNDPDEMDDEHKTRRM